MSQISEDRSQRTEDRLNNQKICHPAWSFICPLFSVICTLTSKVQPNFINYLRDAKLYAILYVKSYQKVTRKAKPALLDTIRLFHYYWLSITTGIDQELCAHFKLVCRP